MFTIFSRHWSWHFHSGRLYLIWIHSNDYLVPLEMCARSLQLMSEFVNYLLAGWIVSACIEQFNVQINNRSVSFVGQIVEILIYFFFHDLFCPSHLFAGEFLHPYRSKKLLPEWWTTLTWNLLATYDGI